MRIFLRWTLFIGVLFLANSFAKAQKPVEKFDMLSKNQKLIIQRNVVDHLQYSNRADGLPSEFYGKKGLKDRSNSLSLRNIHELINEDGVSDYTYEANQQFNYYIPTKKLQENLTFKTPTYHPSFYLNYQVRIKNLSPKLLKAIKGGN